MNENLVEVEPGVYSILVDGVVREARVDGSTVTIAGQRYEIERTDPRKYVRQGSGSRAEGRASVKAPMPGKIVRVLVNMGDPVAAGQGIAVVEAMKMQNEVKTTVMGTVTNVFVKDGDTVIAGALLAVIE